MTLTFHNTATSHGSRKTLPCSLSLSTLLLLSLCGAIGFSGCSGGQNGLGPGDTTKRPVYPPPPPASPTAVITSAVDPATSMVYVVDSGSPQSTSSGTFFAVNGASNSVVTTLTGLSRPTGVDVDSGTNTVYIANGGNNTVSVVSGASNTIIATIPVGSSPSAIAVNETTHTVYVANYNDNTVSIINGATNTVTATIPVRLTGINRIAVDPVLNQIYVGSNQGYAFAIGVINGISNALGTTIYIGNAPQELAVDPTAHILYAESSESTVTEVTSSTEIDAIDESTGAYASTIHVPGFVNSSGLAFNSANSSLYAGNNTSNALDVIRQYSVVASVPYGLSGAVVQSIGINPSTNTIYAVYSISNSSALIMQTINGATNTTLSTLALQ